MYNENYEINSERMTVMDNTFHGIELIKQPTAQNTIAVRDAICCFSADAQGRNSTVSAKLFHKAEIISIQKTK